MAGVDFVNRLDDDSMHLIFDNFQTPKHFLPFGRGEKSFVFEGRFRIINLSVKRYFAFRLNLFVSFIFFPSLQALEWSDVTFLSPNDDFVCLRLWHRVRQPASH